MQAALNAFLLGFPTLLSIVNPMSAAFTFRAVTADRSRRERRVLARKVAFFSFVVMIVALWAGSYILAFFGVTLAALRVAGGVIVALSGWERLNAPGAPRGSQTGSGRARRRCGGCCVLPAHSPLHDRARHHCGSGGLGGGHPPPAVRSGVVLPGDERGRSRCGGAHLGVIRFRRYRREPSRTLRQPDRNAPIRLPADVHRRADPDYRDGRCARSVADARELEPTSPLARDLRSQQLQGDPVTG